MKSKRSHYLGWASALAFAVVPAFVAADTSRVDPPQAAPPQRAPATPDAQDAVPNSTAQIHGEVYTPPTGVPPTFQPGALEHPTQPVSDNGVAQAGLPFVRGAALAVGSPRVRVDDVYTRSLENGCEYRAAVHGTVHETAGSLASGDVPSEARYTPDLRVERSLRCPNAAAHQLPIERVRAAGLTAAELERLVSARASYVDRASGRQCTYTPDYRYTNGELMARGVTLACATTPTPPPARGGGPR